MAIDGGGRNCGVHELICARRVSPELLGVLFSIAVFMALMAVFFLYLSNKLSVESPSDLPGLDSHEKDQRGSLVGDMAFFKSFQQNLPSVNVNISSILDSVSSRVDDLASAVSDVTYTVSDQLTEQVTTIISKVQEDDEDGEDAGENAAGPESRSNRKAKRRVSRDVEASGVEQGAKGGQSSDGAATEGEYVHSQLEWEWRDGCWRVKKTEAELADEERKKKEAQEWEDKREQKRKERRERQREKEASFRKDKEKEAIEEEDEGLGETSSSTVKEKVAGQEEKDGDRPDRSGKQHQSDDGDRPPCSAASETETGMSKNNNNDAEREEEDETPKQDRLQKEEEEELDPPASPTSTKKKKSDKKKGKGTKEGSEKSDKASKKERKREKKSKKKKKESGREGEVSESDEDRDPKAQAPQNSVSMWDNKYQQSREPEGYSSEASSVPANGIQRIKCDSPLNELRPPPYRDEDASDRVPRSHVEQGGGRGSSPERCSSEGSVDQDTESYLNKGYEEDVPSDSTAVLGPEDGSGPQLPAAYEPEPLAKYGTLDVAFEYDSGEQWLAVTVTAATDIPELKQTGNISWQVHLVLLPTKKQRAKTGVQKGPCPVFTETFKFSRVAQEALGDYAVRFRLYSVRRMKKEKVLGEKVFYLTKLNMKGKMALPVTLEPGSELTGCGSVVSVSRSAGALSYHSTGESSTPEILLGLIYNSATGQLSAEVIQGSHFKNTASDKPSDTYVKLTMLDSKGKEMSKCKTAVCRGQPNPTYKETFKFQVALFQLSEVSLVVTVFCRRSSMKPRERIGWVSMGLNSTGEEQLAHWNQMKEAEGQQVCHWHMLTDT